VEEGCTTGAIPFRSCRSCPSPCFPCLEDVCMVSLGKLLAERCMLLLSFEKLPCGEGDVLLMLLAESVLQARWSAAGAAVWHAAVLRRKRRATTCRLGRRGVCCRCCPSAVQLGEWCMLSLEKLSFTCMCCIVLEGETFPAARRQVCNSVHGFPCASIMVHELL
jgi:hypothetical protein